jgi:diaminopimelate epimerase
VRAMRPAVRFAKYHGTGNDFVMVEDLDDLLSLEPALIAAACRRGSGVGADGVIRIVRGDGAGGAAAEFFMDYSNADGEVAEMCGNGIRCLAKYAYDRGLTRSTELAVQTRAGLKHLTLHTRDGMVRTVTVDMGAPAFERKAIPMTGDPQDTFIGQPLYVGGRTYTATALSMGNPHCVLLLDAAADLDSIDVPALGRAVEHRSEFPERTNVEFVQPADGSLRVRVWERGSGETMACGTGACAALVASASAGISTRASELRFPGGLLTVEWGQDDHVTLTGSAVHVFDGELSESWIADAIGEAAAR